MSNFISISLVFHNQTKTNTHNILFILFSLPNPKLSRQPNTAYSTKKLSKEKKDYQKLDLGWKDWDQREAYLITFIITMVLDRKGLESVD